MKKMILALVGMALICTTGTALAGSNILANRGFEEGPTGYGAQDWQAFGNVYTEGLNPAAGFIPIDNQLVSMFGNWTGPYNVSGIFQEFPTSEGEGWVLSCNTRHWGGDPMVGVGAPNDNWVVQKIAFFDAGNNEIGAVESTVLDGTFATDVWHANSQIVGFAPAGTVKFQALILYIQPGTDGGAAHIDNVWCSNGGGVPVEDSSWGKVKALYR
jgi:hypothetical protein